MTQPLITGPCAADIIADARRRGAIETRKRIARNACIIAAGTLNGPLGIRSSKESIQSIAESSVALAIEIEMAIEAKIPPPTTAAFPA